MKTLFILLVATGTMQRPATSLETSPVTGGKPEAGGEPAPAKIVASVREGLPVLPPLRGVLRKDGREIPFVLDMSGPRLDFRFENPEQHLLLETGTNAATLKEEIAGATGEVPASRYGAEIRGTDLTYEDLSMSYLYWPKRESRGEETLKLQKCDVVDLHNPDLTGNYGVVRLFIRKESGAIMRMNAYDRGGHLLKSCSITAAMRFPDAHGKTVTELKSMEIVRYLPGTKKVAGRTRLELFKPER